MKKEGIYFDIDAMKKEGIYFDIDALKKEGIYFIDDLPEMTKKELLNIPGVEEHIFDEIKARLNERGLSLKEEENPV